MKKVRHHELRSAEDLSANRLNRESSFTVTSGQAEFFVAEGPRQLIVVERLFQLGSDFVFELASKRKRCKRNRALNHNPLSF